MTPDLWLAAIAAAGISAYLVFALFYPERF